MSKKYEFNQAINRTFNLLVGLREPAVREHLAPYGLTEADLDEGECLIRDAIEKGQGSVNLLREKRLVTRLDEFESQWFSVAQVKLERAFPAVGEDLFALIDRSRPVNAAWNVGIFIERLRQMERAEQPFGEEGPRARALLAKLGLSEAVVAEAEALAAQLTSFSTATVRQLNLEARDAAQAAMLAWHKEWSTIARKFIKNGTVLRTMGLGVRGGARAKAEPEALPPPASVPLLVGTLPLAAPVTETKQAG